MVDLKRRKVEFMRTGLETGVGPMPNKALHIKSNLYMEITPLGVYVRTHTGQEHLIPYGNIETIKLLPVDEEEKEDKAGH